MKGYDRPCPEGDTAERRKTEKVKADPLQVKGSNSNCPSPVPVTLAAAAVEMASAFLRITMGRSLSRLTLAVSARNEPTIAAIAQRHLHRNHALLGWYKYR